MLASSEPVTEVVSLARPEMPAAYISEPYMLRELTVPVAPGPKALHDAPFH